MLVLAAHFHTHAQPSLFHTYAVFVQSFARYSSWPALTNGFKVVVVGNTKAYDEIVKNVAGKTIAGSAAVVIKSDDDTIMDDGKPTMIIAEREGLHKKGAAMSFIVINNKLKFDINMKELEKRNLKISAQLTTLANDIMKSEPE
jgi:hypothetical protein